MTDIARKMLEDLMGAEALGSGTSVKDVDDPRLCHYYLCGLCPHELFSNTKVDMGACSKMHLDNMKTKYEEEVTAGKFYSYEEELYHLLEGIVRDIDRKIQNSRDRLARDEKYDADVQAKAKKVEELGEEMGITLAKAEALGQEGKVEESLKLMARVEELKKLRVEADMIYREALPPGPPQQQQKLHVCDVCGSFLSILDNDRRLADHFGGRMHIGYVKCREKYNALKTKLGPLRANPRDAAPRERDYDRGRSSERDREEYKRDMRYRDDRRDDRGRYDRDDRGRYDRDDRGRYDRDDRDD